MIVYSPMYSGLLSGKMTNERIATLPSDDWRRRNRNFQEPLLSKNLRMVELLREIGLRHGVTAGEVAIAWTFQNPAVTGAIVGVRSREQVTGIIKAGEFRLSAAEVDEIAQAQMVEGQEAVALLLRRFPIARRFEGTYLFETKVSEMLTGTILFISDHGSGNDSISGALKATGYNVVNADHSTQAIAMLFVMASVTAVVIGQHSIEQSGFDLTRNLRALCPQVPIIALCDGRIDRLPPGVDSCLNTGRPLRKVTSDLKRLLAEKVP